MPDPKPNVIIVGAGLSGLACAVTLHEKGITPLVLEADSRLGGRVRTDKVDGFLLDRGFQVLLTAYPTANSLLDMDALDLRSFDSGAAVYTGHAIHRLMDPLRHPTGALATLSADVGSLTDKWHVYTMRQELSQMEVDAEFALPEFRTIQALRSRWNFSDEIIDRFYRPFIGGVTLDTELTASSRFFEFVTRMFAVGLAAVPAKGMQAIPDQMASRLPGSAIRLGQRVERVTARSATLESGETITASSVVVATDGTTAGILMGRPGDVRWNATITLYFSAPSPPIDGRILLLNGSGSGIVNNLAVMSNIAPEYAPAGQSLIAVSIIGNLEDDDTSIEARVRDELSLWFDRPVDDWRLIELQRIRRALPVMDSVDISNGFFERRSNDVYVIGDHTSISSIEGALRSGRECALAIA